MAKTYITNFELKKQLDKLYGLVAAIQPTNFYEPLLHIQTEDKGDRIYKYKGVYYKTDANLYKAVKYTTNYDKEIKAFRTLLTDLSRNEELWGLGIQPEHIKYVESAGLYVCTDGNFLHKNLTPYRHSHNHSGITLNQNNKPKRVNRAKVVYKLFIDPTVEVVWFKSENFADCRIDNLEEPH
jgi:hypothetical protein